MPLSDYAKQRIAKAREACSLPLEDDSDAAILAEVARTDLPWALDTILEMEGENLRLRGALVGTLGWCACNGTGFYEKPCTLCGDSTYEHNCNDEMRRCERDGCVAARAALAPRDAERKP